MTEIVASSAGSGDSIVIREFESRDARAVVELFVYGKTYDNSHNDDKTRWLNIWFAMDKTKPDSDMSNIEEYYMKSSDEHLCFWVAENISTGEIVGSIATTKCIYADLTDTGEAMPPSNCSYIHSDFNRIFKPSNCLELIRLTVSDRYQRRGIGNMLVAAVEKHAVKLGYTTIYLTTLTGMVGAYNFYTKRNFTNILKVVHSTAPLPNFEHGIYDFEVAHFIREISSIDK